MGWLVGRVNELCEWVDGWMAGWQDGLVGGQMESESVEWWIGWVVDEWMDR